MNPFWRHIPEPTLAAIADDPLIAEGLTPSSRLHFETCDRCRRLTSAHARAASLLRSEWRLVAASDFATAAMPSTAAPRTGAGAAFGRSSVASRPFATIAVVAVLVIVLAAAVVLGAASRRDVSPDKLVFIRDGDVYVARTDGTAAMMIAPGGADASRRGYERLAWDGPSGLIAAASDTGSVVESTLEGLALGSWSAPAPPEHLAFAPGGAYLAYTTATEVRGDGPLVVAARDGRTIFRSAGPVWDFAWSPDGTRLAVRFTAGTFAVVAVDGSGGRVLSTPIRMSWIYDLPGLAWSPDSRSVAVAGAMDTRSGPQKAGSAYIWITDSDGAAIRRLTLDEPAADPSWSPDGRTVDFVRYQEASGAHPGPDPGNGLWSVGSDGSGPHQIYLAQEWNPILRAISPAGDLIAIRDLEAYALIRPDGSGLRRLPIEGYLGGRIAWSSDGRTLYQDGGPAGVQAIDLASGAAGSVLARDGLFDWLVASQ